jgi:hypothetical protein
MNDGFALVGDVIIKLLQNVSRAFRKIFLIDYVVSTFLQKLDELVSI